jgi:hypothetical protein
MANNFANTSWVSMEILRLLLNKKQVAEAFNTDYEKEFKREFAVGSQIQVKLPQRFTIRDGLGYSAQGLNRLTTSVNLDQIYGADFEWDDYEAAVQSWSAAEAELREQLPRTRRRAVGAGNRLPLPRNSATRTPRTW